MQLAIFECLHLLIDVELCEEIKLNLLAHELEHELNVYLFELSVSIVDLPLLCFFMVHLSEVDFYDLRAPNIVE